MDSIKTETTRGCPVIQSYFRGDGGGWLTTSTTVFNSDPELKQLIEDVNVRIECADSWSMARFISGYGAGQNFTVGAMKKARLGFLLINFFRYTPIKVVFSGMGNGLFELTTGVKYVHETNANESVKQVIQFVERHGYKVDTQGVLV